MSIEIETYALDERGRRVISKDPQAVLEYSTNWGPWLAQHGDSILTFSAFAAAGATTNIQAVINVSSVISAIVAGGTVGKLEPVTFHIVTVGGRTDERTIYLKIVQR